jgi:uncharacterized protein YcbK (DUF882 family)
MPLLVFLLALTLGFSKEAQARPRPHWVATPGIELSPFLTEAIDRVAEHYYAKTRRRFTVTSGVRPPARQARAMYAKIAAGGSLSIYRNQSLIEPLRRAYRDGRKKRQSRERIIAAMTEILSDQVARGHYISRHMRGRAFDVGTAGLTKKQRQAFLAAVREAGGMRVIVETKPPHFHIEVLARPTEPAEEDKDGERTDIEVEDK